jgi:predicted outer membrane repeat protein
VFLRMNLIALASALVIAPLAAPAATIHVPANMPTLQEGIDAAAAGDTVLVADGTYTGVLNRDIEFHGVNLTLKSESGSLNTFIDCENVARGFVFYSGEDTTSVVQGFTIENAFADNGGAVVCVNASSPRFEDCVFQQNSVTDIGGAVACLEASKPIFRGCTFGANIATGGPSPRGGAVACLDNSNAVFNRCSFSANTAGALGGGIHCQGSSPSVRHCVFTSNDATTDGGGAIFAMSSSAPVIESCTFMGNTSGYHGGAIYGHSSPVTVSDCLFYQNEAWGWGGALSFLYGESTAQFTDCTFTGNDADIGGVLYCYDDANVSFGNCTFESNSAQVNGSLVAANNASPVFTRSIVASCEGAEPAYCGGTAVPVFFRCVVFGNAAGDSLCGSVSDTLRRDPLFCDAAALDWTLCEDSVCAGANNAWGELLGSKPVGCGSCGSAVRPTTWGAIKAMYR